MLPMRWPWLGGRVVVAIVYISVLFAGRLLAGGAFDLELMAGCATDFLGEVVTCGVADL